MAGDDAEKLIGGGKRLQEYLAEGSQGGRAPWSLLPTQEAIGCAKVGLVAGDGRQFDAFAAQTMVSDRPRIGSSVYLMRPLSVLRCSIQLAL